MHRTTRLPGISGLLAPGVVAAKLVAGTKRGLTGRKAVFAAALLCSLLTLFSGAARAAVQNAGLEADANGDHVPDCWQKGGYGTNSYSFTRTSDAHSGGWAEKVQITSWGSGDRKLIMALDGGTCAQAVQPGHQYRLSGWYKGTAPTNFVVYLRSSSGAWNYWASGPKVPASSAWTQATWTTPAVPAGNAYLSFGLNLTQAGTLTTDDYGLAEPDTTAPDTAIDSGPSDGTATDATFTFHSTEAGSTFACQLDGASWSACTSPKSYSGLPAGQHTFSVRATDAAGNTDASPATGTWTITASAASSSGSPAPSSGHFSTEPSGAAGLPRLDSYCASQITQNPWEPRWDNYLANTTIPLGPVAWSQTANQLYWAKWIANRNQVTGNYTGTTDQIIRWAACKWGIDEDLLRAVAKQESDWHENAKGDYANGNYHSFGLMQVRDSDATSAPGAHNDQGGYPDTLSDTALNVDFYAAQLRSCFDGAFYDGGSWLYNGQTIQQVIATNGADYALWGCVGSWFSGGWYDTGAQNYITSVKTHLSNRDWEKLATSGTQPSDYLPPSTPTNLQAGVAGAQAALTWAPSTDNAGVAGYRIYRNGTAIGTTTSTSYTATGLTSGTSYSFSVAAYDATGNSSARSIVANASG
jgi:hypothetical protein